MRRCVRIVSVASFLVVLLHAPFASAQAVSRRNAVSAATRASRAV